MTWITLGEPSKRMSPNRATGFQLRDTRRLTGLASGQLPQQRCAPGDCKRSWEKRDPQAFAVPAGQLARTRLGWHSLLPCLQPVSGLPKSPNNVDESDMNPGYAGIPRGFRCSHRWRRIALANNTTASISRTVAMTKLRVTAAMICSKRISTSSGTWTGAATEHRKKPMKQVPGSITRHMPSRNKVIPEGERRPAKSPERQKPTFLGNDRIDARVNSRFAGKSQNFLELIRATAWGNRRRNRFWRPQRLEKKPS